MERDDLATSQRGRRKPQVTVADLLVFGPWLIFAAGLAAIAYRLARRRHTARQHRNHSR
jgi:hypothetical protein